MKELSRWEVLWDDIKLWLMRTFITKRGLRRHMGKTLALVMDAYWELDELLKPNQAEDAMWNLQLVMGMLADHSIDTGAEGER